MRSPSVRYARSLINRLHQLKPAELSDEEQLTAKILEFDARKIVDGAPYYWLRFVVTPYTSPIPITTRAYTLFRFQETGDLAAYLDLLKKFPPFLNSLLTHVKNQSSRGILLPKPEVELVCGFLSSYIKDPEHSTFYVSRQRLAGAAAALGIDEFQRNVAAIIQEQINPRFQRLVDFLGGDYQKRAPDGVGLSQYRNGKQFYKYLVTFHTTLDISPEEVHRRGLAAVYETETQMERTRAKLGYAGRKQEFNGFVKTDPRFFPKHPEEMGDRMAGLFSESNRSSAPCFCVSKKRRLASSGCPPRSKARKPSGSTTSPPGTSLRGSITSMDRT